MSRYAVYVIPRAWEEMRDLPGNMRQRVKRAVDVLTVRKRPPYDYGDLGELIEEV